MRRLKEKHQWFLDFKNLEIFEKKYGGRTQLQFQMTIRAVFLKHKV